MFSIWKSHQFQQKLFLLKKMLVTISSLFGYLRMWMLALVVPYFLSKSGNL